jgi:hypothetical protein
VSRFVSEMHPWPGTEPEGFFLGKGVWQLPCLLLELKDNCKTRITIPWLESMKLPWILMLHSYNQWNSWLLQSSLQMFEP